MDDVVHVDGSFAYYDVRVAGRMIGRPPFEMAQAAAFLPEAEAASVGVNEKVNRHPIETLSPAAVEISARAEGDAHEAQASSLPEAVLNDNDLTASSETATLQARIDTPAVKRAREKIDAQRACQRKLTEIMRDRPNSPIAKSQLRKRFPDFSERAFDERSPWLRRT